MTICDGWTVKRLPAADDGGAQGGDAHCSDEQMTDFYAALEGDWQTGLPPSPGFYYVRDLLHESIGGDNRPVYVNPEHFVWGFTDDDDPEWIGLDNDITPENIQWKPAAPPSLKDQALAQLASLHAELKMHGLGINTDTIRRALDALPDD